MQRRYARTLQRLALVAGICAGAWLAAEGLDHGTARADDVPIRVETEQPGGLLDQTSDTTEAPPGPPADPTPAPGETGPEQTEEPDHPLPSDGTVGAVGAVGAVDAPDPTDGDDGSPQHPVDTPPDPGPTDTGSIAQPAPAGAASEPEVPATDAPAADPPSEIPPLDGDHTPAPHVPADNVQAEPSRDPACDSRGATPAAPRPGTRDRLASPRGLAGPGPTSVGCDLTAVTRDNEPPPLTKPPSGDPLPGAPQADYSLPKPDRPARLTAGNDTTPPSRLTPWPPGPG